MTTHSIRVPLVTPGEKAELKAIEEKILAERGRISLLYQVLLNSLPVAEGWEAMLTSIRNRTSIDPALRELVILRVAVLNRAEFEYEAHVPHAIKAGLSKEKIDTIRTIDSLECFTPLERMVITLTDRMTRDIEVPHELMEEIKDIFGPTGTVELAATVAAYNMVSRFLVCMNIKH